MWSLRGTRLVVAVEWLEAGEKAKVQTLQSEDKKRNPMSQEDASRE
jgi:hypothetical protein